eukprot:TRINITY_DN1691_c0_g1_i1.p1 TRINITY_DN1691_c0_g1~~TRINITY_DN1691_c0_g1_i1.p1  ORF type:complete len:691 (+),score=30.43 TRINITY_DN1691_c0_g1_i1:288-2075(+)
MIADRVVLTAAHCLREESTTRAHNLVGNQQYEGQMQGARQVYAAIAPHCRHQQGKARLKVERFYMPTQYTNNVYDGYDIALIVLEGFGSLPLDVVATYPKILSTDAIPDNSVLSIIGWGKTSIDEDLGSTVVPLQEATQQLYDTYTCNNGVQPFSVQIDLQICTKYVEANNDGLRADTCQGDSGGPLLYIDPVNTSNITQIGITSWGPEATCSGRSGLPGIYTNIGVHIDWIQGTLQRINGLLTQYVDAMLKVEEPIALNAIDCNHIDALSCDVDALLAFKSAIVSEQDIFSSWIGDDPCEWRYIQCTSIDGRSHRVTKVNLDFSGSNFDNTLSGTLVKEISKLRYLTEFSLTNQEGITGQLYPEYSVLNKLVSFENWRTDVYGTLPSEYSTWTNLEDFSCSYNTISGTLPPEYSTWVMLRNIYVGVNNIKGAIPFQYSTWSSIVNFDVSGNQLSGSLPPFFSSWTQCCDDFNLNFNSLSGTLPVEYSLMAEMVEFKLAQNSISGTLPAEYSAWVKCCGRFYLYSNELTGTLPPEYSTMSRMELFAIDDNNLSGRLPVDYSTMINIDLFHANDNFFIGNTPDEWSTWSNDVEIWL